MVTITVGKYYVNSKQFAVCSFRCHAWQQCQVGAAVSACGTWLRKSKLPLIAYSQLLQERERETVASGKSGKSPKTNAAENLEDPNMSQQVNEPMSPLNLIKDARTHRFPSMDTTGPNYGILYDYMSYLHPCKLVHNANHDNLIQFAI